MVVNLFMENHFDLNIKLADVIMTLRYWKEKYMTRLLCVFVYFVFRLNINEKILRFRFTQHQFVERLWHQSTLARSTYEVINHDVHA